MGVLLTPGLWHWVIAPDTDGVTNLVVFGASGVAIRKVFSPFFVALVKGAKHCSRVLHLLGHMEATVDSSLCWYGMVPCTSAILSTHPSTVTRVYRFGNVMKFLAKSVWWP